MWGQKHHRRRARGTRITWKDPAVKRVATARPITPQYQAQHDAPADVVPNMVVGGAVATRYGMSLIKDNNSYPFPLLDAVRPNIGPLGPLPAVAQIPAGSLLVYSGPIRVNERRWHEGREMDVRVIRHTFITGMGRVIILNLSNLKGV